jgi:hypothetical protein
MLSSPVSLSSSIRFGGTTSANRLTVASTGRIWLFMGMYWPLILMIAGAWADR